MSTTATLDTVQVAGLRLAFRELGSGPPVLLLHGWPTSSLLWRDVMPSIARQNRVIALDLPGFGGSDKPLDAHYDFDFFDRALDGFLAALGIDSVAIAGHDIGGPISLHWALARPERVTQVALLNTLVYPEFSDMVVEFVTRLSNPESREELTGPEGLAWVMRLGVADEGALSDEAIAGVVDPFGTDEARQALAKAGIELPPEGFDQIAERLPALRAPLRVVYGEQDRILPDIAQTARRLRRDVPHAEITALPHFGHFLQEEAGPEVGELLAPFFARVPAG